MTSDGRQEPVPYFVDLEEARQVLAEVGICLNP